MLIDYGYEDRLVDRIAVNEAIAARLDPRQRRVLLRYHRYGETLEEVGRREGVTRERIRSVLGKSYDRLRTHLEKTGRPQPTTRTAPPPGFDKAAFVRHMRLLIELREQHTREWERREFEIERAEVARLVAGEAAKNAPSLPHLGNTLKIKLPVQYTAHKSDHSVNYSSPNYHPPPLPTLGDLNRIAHTALIYLLAGHPSMPLGGVSESLGKWCTSVVFTRDGGEVSEAVNSIVRELPAHARLSAYPVPIEDGTLGAHATAPYASLRVTVTPDGLKLRFDVTWD